MTPMSSKVDAILNAAMELSDEERVDLADRLFSTLSDEYRTEVDRAWAEEIDRRAKEIDEGRVTLVPWDEVRDRMLKRTKG
jgi:putative addiction module component (TIGR02574 family)